jgi:uncharacterized protein
LKYLNSITDVEQLFDPVGEASLRKEVSTLHQVYQDWISKSPFAVLATVGPDGLDTSPRGDPLSVVRVLDERTILLPERKGNNRIDSLRNIIFNPSVSLIFFVPGVKETVRVNGTAKICVEDELLRTFEMQGSNPKCVLEITVETVYFQCARALLRSALWSPHQLENRPEVPTAGAMLAALTSNSINGKDYDLALPARQISSLY